MMPFLARSLCFFSSAMSVHWLPNSSFYSRRTTSSFLLLRSRDLLLLLQRSGLVATPVLVFFFAAPFSAYILRLAVRAVPFQPFSQPSIRPPQLMFHFSFNYLHRDSLSANCELTPTFSFEAPSQIPCNSNCCFVFISRLNAVRHR